MLKKRKDEIRSGGAEGKEVWGSGGAEEQRCRGAEERMNSE